MKEKLEALKVEALAKLQEVMDPQVLNDLRVKYLGKKASLQKFYVVWEDLVLRSVRLSGK